MEDSRVALARRWPVVVTSFLCLIASASPEALGANADPGAAHAGIGHRSRGSFHFRWVERCFMKKINRRRSARDLSRLRWDRQMGYVARRHARAMASAGIVSHDGWLAARVTHWRALGQNSGRGNRCRSLFRAFWRSPLHRSNILGRWRYMGVGVKRRRGELFVQQVFEYRSNPGNIWGLP
jgi:Cysteine-rich secretory protein family